MKKRILTLSTALLLSMGLVACGTGTTSEKPSSQATSETQTSNPNTSSEQVTSKPVTTNGGGDVQQEKMPVYYKDLNAGARTRKYNADYDLMLNDFTSETLVGEISGDATQVKKNYLKVSIESSHEESYPNSDDKSIYKQARKENIASYDGIAFRMRLVKGKLPLENLVLGLRGDDSFKIFELKLSDALDNDGEAVKELTSEYQDIIVSPKMSLDQEVYKNKDGSDTTTKVIDTIVGFHLYVQGDIHAMIEIESIYGISGATKTTFEDFNHVKTNDAADDTWWKDSTGYIVSKSVVGIENGSYKLLPQQDVSEYANVVLSLTADSNKLSLVPVYENKDGTPIAWTALKDDQNTALVDPVNGCYGAYVINIVNSGINVEGLKGLKLVYETEVSLNTIFMTNMQEKEAATTFPILNTENAVVFDNFNRTQGQLDSSYDTAAVNPVVTEAGLNWAYTDAASVEDITISDGAAKIKNTKQDFTKLDEGTKATVSNQRYMVVSTKVEDGATYDNFRITMSDKTVYYNDWYAAQGIKSSSELNPYVKDGYTWNVIDLELMEWKADAKMVIYYTGAGTLSIDTIFFCDDINAVSSLVPTSFPGETAKVMDSTNSSHQWLSAGLNSGSKYIQLKYVGNGQDDLASFRLESTGGENQPIFANAGTLKMFVNGEAIDSTFVAPAETETVMIIDLEASGWTDFNSEVTLVLGDWAKGYMDVKECNMLKPKEALAWNNIAFDEASGNINVSASEHGFCYVGNFKDPKQLRIKFKGDGVVDLASFRLENTETHEFVAANSGNLKMYVNGEAIDSTFVAPADTDTVMVIDLAASSDVVFTSHFGIVFGDWAPGCMKISKLEYAVDTNTPENIMNNVPEMYVPSEAE